MQRGILWAALGAMLALGAESLAAEKNPVVIIKTNHGAIEAELFADKAPVTVENFLKYTNDKFYDGTVFHRVIPNFMIQGGGFDKALNQKTTRAPIKNEAENGLKNTRGTLAMARTSEVNSATAQFFINLKDNGFLDNGTLNNGVPSFGYAVFGKVLTGMDVVDKIAAQKTGRKGPFPSDVPQQDVVIESVQVKK